MPFKIVKDPKKGYFVMDTSGKKYSKKPLSLARAKRQLAALHIHTGHGLIVGYDKPEKSLKGGITNKRYFNFLERLMILSKKVYDDYHISSDGDIKSSNPMELIMALVQTYFSPTEYELINNSTVKDNLRQLFDATHIDQFITLLRSFYPNGRFETFIRMFIRDFQNVDLSPNEKIDKITELIKLVEIELLEEMFKQYIQEPVDYSKIRKEFKGGGYYQNELHRRMERFPEHIANPIIARTLPLLREVGPSTQLFKNNPAKQQQKQDIIDNAIAEAQEITNRRRQRILPRGSTYITSMDDIKNNDQVIDYANNSKSQVYHSPADWNDWLNERQRQGLPFTDPYSNVIVKDRNIERFIAKIPPPGNPPQQVSASGKPKGSGMPEDTPPPPGWKTGSGKRKLKGGDLWNDYIRPGIRWLVQNNIHHYAAMLAGGIFEGLIAVRGGPGLERVLGIPQWLTLVAGVAIGANNGLQFIQEFEAEVRRQIAENNPLQQFRNHVYDEVMPERVIPPDSTTVISREDVTHEMPLVDINRTAKKYSDRLYTPGEIEAWRANQRNLGLEPTDPMTREPIRNIRHYNANVVPNAGQGKFSEPDILIGDNILTGGKVRFTDFNIFVQWLNAMFYELLTKPKNERNNIFKARTEIKSGLPTFDKSKRTFIVYNRVGRYLSLKTHPIGEYDKWFGYYTNKDNIAEWGFPINDVDNNALERDDPLDKDSKWKDRKSGAELFFTRTQTPLNYPTLGTPSSSPSSSPKATNSSPKEGPSGFAPGSGPVSLVSASEMAGGPPPPVPGTEGPKARKFRENVMKLFGWSEEKVKEHPEYQGYLARGEGKVKFVKKYLKGQGLPATKKNVAKVCDIMDTEGIVFEGNK